MAQWRIKACDVFGLSLGSYSSTDGKWALLRDLAAQYRDAVEKANSKSISKIMEYASLFWDPVA